MNKKNIYAIGLMSGTSLDGVDIAYVRFNIDDYQDFEIKYAKTYSYIDEWIHILKNALNYKKADLKDLHNEYGNYLGDLAFEFIDAYQIKTIDFIASHGHTIFHQPDKGITLQIGNGQNISNRIGCKVICDFRTQDVKLGGQGAPLVPIGDQFLFSQHEVCLNLGGFANISFQIHNKRIAFDICPVNVVLNFYAQKMGFLYDKDGDLSSRGRVNSDLLNELNEIPYYQKVPPKSLGIEWVHQNIIPKIDQYELEVKDILRTYVEHIAIQISKVMRDKKNILITGGGAFNLFLINRLESMYKGDIILPDKIIIEYKEALVFAFLGLLRFQNKINCLSSVTGARKDHSSGRIFNSKNH